MRPLFLALLISLISATAKADNDSVMTLGVGSHTVLSRPTVTEAGGPQATFGGQGFTARLRLLYLFGAELSYDMMNQATQAHAAPTYRWSGLLYLVPTARFSLFVLAGFGAGSTGDLFAWDGASTSYHMGSGFEIGISPNWVLGADVRLNVPGLKTALNNSVPGQTPVRSAGDYYARGLWQANLGFRYYL